MARAQPREYGGEEFCAVQILRHACHNGRVGVEEGLLLEFARALPQAGKALGARRVSLLYNG